MIKKINYVLSKKLSKFSVRTINSILGLIELLFGIIILGLVVFAMYAIDTSRQKNLDAFLYSFSFLISFCALACFVMLLVCSGHLLMNAKDFKDCKKL